MRMVYLLQKLYYNCTISQYAPDMNVLLIECFVIMQLIHRWKMLCSTEAKIEYNVSTYAAFVSLYVSFPKCYATFNILVYL